MKLTEKEFIDNVKSEIKAIKKHASKEEKKNLIFKDFRPTSGYDCVYGQMARHCRSDRAIELIEKCCVVVVPSECWTDVSRYEADANNCKFLKIISKMKLQEDEYFSALELFIVDRHYSKFNELILQFIKGKINTLSFIKLK